MIASDSFRNSELSSVPASAVVDWELGTAAIGSLEQMPVEAGLGLTSSWVVAKTPFHVPQMGSGKFDFDVNYLQT